MGTKSTSKTYLNLALFSKPFFKDFGSILVGFWVPKWWGRGESETSFSALASFGFPLASLGLLLASPWPLLASPWRPFGSLLGSIGLPLAPPWPPLASLWLPFCFSFAFSWPFFCLGLPLDSLSHFIGFLCYTMLWQWLSFVFPMIS